MYTISFKNHDSIHFLVKHWKKAKDQKKFKLQDLLESKLLKKCQTLQDLKKLRTALVPSATFAKFTLIVQEKWDELFLQEVNKCQTEEEAYKLSRDASPVFRYRSWMPEHLRSNHKKVS